jgi:hypothetical protein
MFFLKSRSRHSPLGPIDVEADKTRSRASSDAIVEAWVAAKHSRELVPVFRRRLIAALDGGRLGAFDNGENCPTKLMRAKNVAKNVRRSIGDTSSFNGHQGPLKLERRTLLFGMRRRQFLAVP